MSAGPELLEHYPVSAEWEQIALVDEAIGVIGSHPAKIATLLTLAQYPDKPFSAMDIIHTINDATGHNPQTILDKGNASQFASYCVKSLAPAGVVELATKETPRGSKGATQQTAAFKITAKGLAAVPVAGGLGRWEIEHPHLSLRELLGSTRHLPNNPAERGPLTRLSILAEITNSPPGGVALAELEANGGDVLTEYHVRQLGNLAVVEQLSKSNPAHRRIGVLDPQTRSMSAFVGNMSPEMRALYITAARLRAKGVTNLDGVSLLQELATTTPHINPDTAWKALLSHQPNCLAFTDNDEFGPKAYRTKFRLAGPYKAAVTDLLATVGLLRQNPDYQNEAKEYGMGLLDDMASMTILIGKAYRKSRRPSRDEKLSTEQIIAESIPPEGTTIKNLLTTVIGRRTLSIMTLRNYLKSMPGILVEQTQAEQGRARKIGLVTLWNRQYPIDWQKQAACVQKDAERFFPVSDIGLSAQNIEQAKTICRTCRVRPACLKTAMDTGPDGIWGGFTEGERRNLPLEIRPLLDKVTIS
jgi:WhiB family redox-sensing transcriptional regulator